MSEEAKMDVTADIQNQSMEVTITNPLKDKAKPDGSIGSRRFS